MRAANALTLKRYSLNSTTMNNIIYNIIERICIMNINRGYYFFTPMNIVSTLRNLWEQHSFWTRSFIASAAHDLPDLQFVTERLLRNPTDFVMLLQPFYGEASKEFEKLLTEHLLIAARLVNEAKIGNSEAADAARDEWYRNGDEIAYFLSRINPYWSFEEWREMFRMHLDLVEKEAVLRLTGQYAEDIALFDTIEQQALSMADIMSDGIISQFRLYEHRMR